MGTQFNCQKHFYYFKLIQIGTSTDFVYSQLNVKIVLY